MSTPDSIRSHASAKNGASPKTQQRDLLCFSHLRWDFVYQRPQHLLSRAAATRRVFFWEEPVFVEAAAASLSTSTRGSVCVVRPLLPQGLSEAEVNGMLRKLLSSFVAAQHVEDFIAWYYTPMALSFTADLEPAVTIYDCMDELSAFAGAPPELKAHEAELFRKADVVFTGGRSLYESKRTQHPNVRLYPSSIDRAHFAAAREPQPDPADQRAIPHPRVGFFGVIDERFDRELVAQVAALRPAMHFVLIGPVVKVKPEDLPVAANLHYVGQKSYDELPAYIAGWDAAILPFALNASTAFISPTKTPEYLAAGMPVVSTPIRDVVRDYGEPGLVEIAATSQQFAAALDRALQSPLASWRDAVEAKLAKTSWDQTWESMSQDVRQAIPQTLASVGGGAHS